MNDTKKIGWTEHACLPFAERMREDGYAAFSVRIIECDNVSGGTCKVVGLATDTNDATHEGNVVNLPTGVLGNLFDACNYIGCWIDLAIRAEYANGNNDLVPYAWRDDVEHFGLQCDQKG